MSPSAHPDLRLGPFDLEQVVGRGGMGVVWRGRHRMDGLPVAIKLIAAPSDLDTQRFRKEAEAVARLSHPHIVAVYDYGTVPADADRASLRPGAPFLVMDLLDGGSLGDVGLGLGWDGLRVAALAMLDALACAHARAPTAGHPSQAQGPACRGPPPSGLTPRPSRMGGAARGAAGEGSAPDDVEGPAPCRRHPAPRPQAALGGPHAVDGCGRPGRRVAGGRSLAPHPRRTDCRAACSARMAAHPRGTDRGAASTAGMAPHPRRTDREAASSARMAAHPWRTDREAASSPCMAPHPRRTAWLQPSRVVRTRVAGSRGRRRSTSNRVTVRVASTIAERPVALTEP